MICKNGHYYSGDWCHICQEPLPKKKPKPINKVSKKRIDQNKEYSKVRDQYLKIFEVCEVKNCMLPSSQIHHKAGRVGQLLTDVNHFLAVCDTCHKYIHDNVKWSQEYGYMELRSK